MLGKTLILGLISAGAAGAIVYYGTAPQGSDSLQADLNETVKAEEPVKMERKLIEPRLPTVRKAADDDGRKKLASGAELPKPSVEKTIPSKSDEEKAAPQKETRWLDQYLKKNKSENKDRSSEDLKAQKDKEARTSSDSAVNSYTVNERAAIEDIEPEVMLEDAPEAKAPEVKAEVIDRRTFRIENGKLVEIDPSGDVIDKGDVIDEDDMAQMEEAQEASDRHDKMMAEGKGKKALTHKFTSDMTNMANDSTPLLSTVMREAAEIKKPELRDQAYFEITEYALSEGRFDSARMAHDMIEQDELSYTAKSRIAVAYAQNGEPTKAFKVIGEVDEAELRDFMRLQVIEALIAPENLPQGWRENTN